MFESIFSNSMNQGHIREYKSTSLILVLTSLILTNIILTDAAITPEIASKSDNFAHAVSTDSSSDLAFNEQKRNWQSLQSSWGKRAPVDENNDEDLFLAERWIPILSNNGERSDPALKYSLVLLTNMATLEHLAKSNLESSDVNDIMESNEDIPNEKRTWKDMNVAWGKRRTEPTWNKFQAAWGKREPGWNNLKGMWGKRSGNDWQKLHGGWGKRS